MNGAICFGYKTAELLYESTTVSAVAGEDKDYSVYDFSHSSLVTYKFPYTLRGRFSRRIFGSPI